MLFWKASSVASVVSPTMTPPSTRRQVRELLAVAGSDDVGLDRVLGDVRRIARDDASLVEGAVTEVGAAAGLAAVAAAAQHDGALLLHGAPAAGESALVVRAEGTGGRVATAQRELRRPVVLQHGGDVGARLRRVVLVLVGVVLGEDAVLEIGH